MRDWLIARHLHALLNTDRKDPHFHASIGVRTHDTHQSYIPTYAQDKIMHKFVPSYMFK